MPPVLISSSAATHQFNWKESSCTTHHFFSSACGQAGWTRS